MYEEEKDAFRGGKGGGLAGGEWVCNEQGEGVALVGIWVLDSRGSREDKEKETLPNAWPLRFSMLLSFSNVFFL